MTILTNRFSISLLAGALAAATALPALAGVYDVDPDHSHVGFSVRHLVSHVPGEFKTFTGKFDFDPKKPDADKASFTIKVASISTNNDKRDNHLRSPDFFDASKYPTITFESTQMKPEGTDKYKLTGNMTMHGVTKPVTFDVDYNGSTKSPSGGTATGFTATTRINRKDFGIVWNKVLDAGGAMLGDDVDIKIDIEADEKAAGRHGA